MSFSYSGDPSASLLDEIRFRIADTDENDPMFQDEEINFELKTNSNNIGKTLLSLCATAMANVASQVDYKEGPESVKLSDLYDHYSKLYSRFKAQYRSASHAGIWGKTSPPIFNIGMHDNRA